MNAIHELKIYTVNRGNGPQLFPPTFL